MTPPRPPTIRDVAARAGVSKSLVSLALQGSSRVSPERRLAIEAAAAELGYRPNAAARNLGSSRSRTIGIFLLDLHNPISADMVDALQAEARRRDFRTILVIGSDDPVAERAEVEKLMEFRVEGIIAFGHRLPAGSRQVIGSTCPTIIVGSEHRSTPHLMSVSNDDLAGAVLAVEHLVELGHRRISHVSGGGNEVALRRQAGYEQAMRAHRLTRYIRFHQGAFTDVDGHRAMAEALQADPRPSAVFVCSDYAAIGAMAAAQEAGLRVPEDVSIVGYDGTSLAALPTVSLTTIAQPITEMGTLAASMLADRLDLGVRPPKSTRLTPHLVVRTTTAPPP